MNWVPEDDISEVDVEKPARDSDMESEAMNDEDIPDREAEEAIEADWDPHPPPVMVYSTGGHSIEKILLGFWLEKWLEIPI